MNIAAITQFRPGDLWRIMKKLNLSTKALADAAGLSRYRCYRFMKLRYRPTLDEATKIQRALGELGEYLDIEKQWPEEFDPLMTSCVEQFKDVDPSFLLAASKTKYLQAPDRGALDINILTKDLNDKELYVVERRASDTTMEDIARELGVTRGRIDQIEKKAYLKMRRRLYIEEKELERH